MSGVSVTRLSWTPMKGTRLHLVDEVELDELGALGDRRFFVVDTAGEMVNSKRLGELTQIVASCANGTLTLTFPDRSVVSGGARGTEALTAGFYGEPREVRLVPGRFSEAISEHCGRPLRLVEAGRAVDRGRRGAVTVISRGSLERLAAEGAQRDVDARRFRMLIELDGLAAHEEDRWVGSAVGIGDVVLRLNGHVGRCAITTRNPDSGVVDLPTLKLLGRYRRDEETTEPVAFGVYGEVVQPGVVRVGDAVRVLG